MKISANLITLNEEAEIGEAIDSLDFADEILVVDSESTDRTVAIARDRGARVIVQPWLGFGRQKAFAVDQCDHDWTFCLDADERVSPELGAFLRELKRRPPRELADGYAFPRRSHYFGRPLRSSYPEWHLRLFHRERGQWSEDALHESVQMRPGATTERVGRDILHYSIRSVRQHHDVIGERWAPVHADMMWRAGQRTSPVRALAAGPAGFAHRFVRRKAFMDGFAGLCISTFAGYEAFLCHLHLWEMQQGLREPPPP